MFSGTQNVLLRNRKADIITFFSAEDSDDDFNLIQPSLIKQLRKILDQYPDDGQILKVGYARIYFSKTEYLPYFP